MNFKLHNTMSRNAYIASQKEESQRRLVNYKTSATSSKCIYNWSYRNTSCDVISIVTTTVPKENGDMKDIKHYNKEMRRIRGPQNKLGSKSYRSPLAEEGDADGSIARKRLHKMLCAEKDTFMSRLKRARNYRSTVENSAVIKIQKTFRGHSVRFHLETIRNRQLEIKKVREIIRSRLRTLGGGMHLILTNREKRFEHIKSRNKSALIIQNAFRCFISRRYLSRKRTEVFGLRTSLAIQKMQSWVRMALTIRRFKGLKHKHNMRKQSESILKIQRNFRAMLARRIVARRRFILHWVAATIIQTFYRQMTSKRMVKIIRLEYNSRKKAKGAIGFQKIIRGRLGRIRFQRIKIRYNKLKQFRMATKIQTMIRKFIAIHRIKKLLHTQKEKNITGNIGDLDDEYDEAIDFGLFDDYDIFLQAKKGNVTQVDDIYTGRITDDVHTTTEVDDNGDTVLTIAAANGHLELVRKCLIWGFNINHRNYNDQNALVLAAIGGNKDVVQYLLQPSSDPSPPPSRVLHEPISNADVGAMIVAASTLRNMELLLTFDARAFDFTATHPETGLSVMHVACSNNDEELLRWLFKRQPSFEESDKFDQSPLHDEMGQSPLHKACARSLRTVGVLLDLMGVTSGDSDATATKAELYRATDGDGKDCALIAALAGQTEVLEDVKAVLKSAAPLESAIEIGWTPNDVNNAIMLASDGNLSCLEYIIEMGFDPAWAQEATSTTIAMAAAFHGQLDVVALLLSKATRFDCVDSLGRTALHYAAYSEQAGETIALILQHPNAKKCGVDYFSLVSRDKAGRSVIYIAAASGGGLRLDLLAGDAVREALELKDDLGLTPLMAAAVCGQVSEVRYLLSLGASPLAMCNKGKNTLWHMFNNDSKGIASIAHKLPLVPPAVRNTQSQSQSQSIISSSGGPGSTSARDVLEILDSLLAAGCPIFSTATFVEGDDVSTEIAAVAVASGNIGLIERLPSKCTTEDCWRIALICLAQGEKDEMMPCLTTFLKSTEVAGLMAQTSQSEGSVAAKTDTTNSKSPATHALEGLFYRGWSLLGYALKFGNNNAFKALLSVGLRPFVPLDEDGNTALHLACKYDNVDAVRAVLAIKGSLVASIPFEIRNKPHARMGGIIQGLTAVGVGALAGSMRAVSLLVKAGADPRTGLEGKYSAWLLAIVRRKEKYETNLQTGYFGDDDVKYFPTAPDPMFVFW